MGEEPEAVNKDGSKDNYKQNRSVQAGEEGRDQVRQISGLGCAIAICHDRTCGNRETGRIPEANHRLWLDRPVFLLPPEPAADKARVEVRTMPPRGQQDGSQRGKRAGGRRRNQTDKCRNPERKKDR